MSEPGPVPSPDGPHTDGYAVKQVAELGRPLIRLCRVTNKGHDEAVGSLTLPMNKGAAVSMSWMMKKKGRSLGPARR